ncbi:kelch-like protein 11 [Dreissena polymorpha]|nr:kelch-like protein 11 [Dreissena polymorpha]
MVDIFHYSYSYNLKLSDLLMKAPSHLCIGKHLYQQTMDQSEYCDVTIVAGHKTLKAHWCVLVMCPYFQALYHSGLKERQEGQVQLQIGNSDVIVDVISFLYSGTITVNDKRVKDILQVADYLQIDSLTQLCDEYLRRSVTFINCTQFILLSKTYRLKVYDEVMSYLLSEIPIILNRPDAVQLPVDVLLRLIQDPTLSYVPRSLLFEFLVRWVDNDPKQREEFFETVFHELDLLKLDKAFIKEQVMTCQYVSGRDSCVKRCSQSLTRLLSPSTDGRIDAIVVLGGIDERNSRMDYMFAYIVNENRWTKLLNVHSVSETPSISVCGSTYVHVFKQINGDLVSNEYKYFKKFSFVTNEWQHLYWKNVKNLPEDLIITSVNAMLFATSTGKVCYVGFCKSKNGKKPGICACLVGADAQSTFPFRLVCLTSARKTMRVCIVHERYVCIVIRSINGRQLLLKLYLIDTAMQSWRVEEYSTSSVFLSRGYDHCFVLTDKVFVTKDIFKDDFITFDITTRTWTTMKSKSFPVPKLLNYSFATLGNKMFVFGGKDEASCVTKNVYVLDFDSGSCTQLSPMPMRLFNSQAVRVRIPGNVCHRQCPHCNYRADFITRER